MAASAAAETPCRTAVRWGLLLAGVITAAMRVPELRRYWIQWQALKAAVPLASQSYRTYLLVESAITVFVLAMAAGLFWALGPRQKRAD